jgi:hypothetical protein
MRLYLWVQKHSVIFMFITIISIFTSSHRLMILVAKSTDATIEEDPQAHTQDQKNRDGTIDFHIFSSRNFYFTNRESGYEHPQTNQIQHNRDMHHSSRHSVPIYALMYFAECLHVCFENTPFLLCVRELHLPVY